MGQLNCLRCAYRHEDNGNCTASGGFCTAVPAAHCRLLQKYEDTGLTPEEINDLASVREISPEAEYAINKHADGIIERLDKLLAQTDDDDRPRELAEADKEGRVAVLPCKVLSAETEESGQMTLEQAIEHLENVLKDHDFECESCKQDHMALLGFLNELKERRAENG